MEELKIAISVSVKTALACGMSQYGSASYPIADVLPLLATGTREWLIERWSNDQRQGGYFVRSQYQNCVVAVNAAPSAESVAAGIEEMRCVEIKLAEQAAERREQNIVDALALPDDVWICRPGTAIAPRVSDDPRGVYLDSIARADPRVLARKERLTLEVLPVTVAAWEAERVRLAQEADQKANEKKRIEAEKAAAKAARQAAIREWVVKCGDAAKLPLAVLRAAREGRDVSDAVGNAVDASVCAAIKAAIPQKYQSDVVVGSKTYGEHEMDRRVPTQRAYDVRDALVAARELIIAAVMLPGVGFTVGDFQRFDVSSDDAKIYRSGVDVIVKHPWYPAFDFGQIVLTEPLNYPSQSDSDEDAED